VGLWWVAPGAVEQACPALSDAGDPESDQWSPDLQCKQTAMEVTIEAVQVFGGAGYMRETRVEQLMRDAKILQIYAGTDEMQVVAIAKDLMGRA
jgi:alkylation response protein AidB-like acyl-CoA dehydrogenase